MIDILTNTHNSRRLGNKYEVDEFCDEAIHHLGRLYPQTFIDLEEVALSNFRGDGSYLQLEKSDLFPFANLLESLDLRRLLSHVLYQCCTQFYELTDLVNGVMSPYGSPGERVKLSAKNLKRCLKAIPLLISAEMLIRTKSVLQGSTLAGTLWCTTPTTCRLAWTSTITAFSHEDEFPLGGDPMYPYLQQDRFWNSTNYKPCPSCRDACIREADRLREEFSQTIGSVFGLGK